MVIKLEGNWHSGLAFDLHTVSSTHLGADKSGRDHFENTRSEMGELLYQLKYRNNNTGLLQIVALLDAVRGIENFDYIVPIPPTNKKRPAQPVELIAVALGAHRKVKVWKDLLINAGDEELKGISDPVERIERLQKAINLTANANVIGTKILLVDDLYRSGATLHIATDLLYKVGKAEKVSVLTMTKTRSHR